MIFCNGAIATAIFVVLLLNHKRVRLSRANLFLSVLLIALAFSIVHIMYAGSVIRHFSNNVYSPGDPTFLLIAPLSWFYAVELTGRRVIFSGKLLSHFVPFLLVICLSVSFGSGLPRAMSTFINEHRRLLYIFFRVLVVGQFLGYQYFINKTWQAHQRLLQQEMSNTENVNIGWVKLFSGIFLIINLFFLLSLFIAIHWENSRWLAKATAVVFSSAVYVLGFRGILQRDVFDTIQINSGPEPVIPAPQETPVLTKPDQLLIDKLVACMTEKKPYLDPELSLSTLAKELKMSRSQLSQLINDGMGENFYDFINKYRVEEVKRLMADPGMAGYNLLGIAFEAGFKSKSTFNLIFKRFTGLTPTEYRKNISA
ncbi:AraC family transcriptional regulator [Niastella vici]|nr:helix-turn-helix domain-containing protein [Niastella vici]